MEVRVVWPQDVKRMSLQQARMVYWKKWAAKHECEELMEGVRADQAMLRRKDQRVMYVYAPQCDEEGGRGRRMCAEKNVRHCLVGRTEVPGVP